MIRFHVQNMTCGHCVRAITQAITSADPQARVDIDLANHAVSIEPALADAAHLQQAIEQAGYEAMPVAPGPVPAPAARSGCCGGGCRCH